MRRPRRSGTVIPIDDAVIYVTHDDGVVAQVEQARLFVECAFYPLTAGNVMHKNRGTSAISVGSVDRKDGQEDVERCIVLAHTVSTWSALLL